MSNSKKITQAQKAAANAKNKAAKNKPSTSKTSASPAEKMPKERIIPVRFFSAAFFLCMFLIMTVIFFVPEGAVMKIIYSLIHGLIGRAGYIISIPVLLYMFAIHAFSGKRPVCMRTVCLLVFILCCGCITHLSLDPQGLSPDAALLPELYAGGNDGTTGGLLCGGLAMLIRWLCGPVIPYFLLVIAAVFTLLGGMQITVPSIVRAIRNRPRADWEQDVPERQEPAAVVVNHLANKHIANQERKRHEKEERQLTFEDVQQNKQNRPKNKPGNAQEIMKQLESDVDVPVIAAGKAQPEITKTASQETTITEPVVPEIPTSHVPDLPLPKAPSLPITLEPIEKDEPPKPVIVPDVKKETVTSKDAEASAQQVAQEIAEAENEVKPEYKYPPVDLLNLPDSSNTDIESQVRATADRLNETLESFKIEAHITHVTTGPTVTRYEVELEKGVRLNKLENAAKDIALSLGVNGVRIETIPGKSSVVGIEVPNDTVTTVSLRSVIDSDAFYKAKSYSSFAVGKDIGGKCIIGNIAKLPHMLIAGTTGSGKSVCMNSLIISLLYKAGPENIKLIMIDPKMVELGIYNGIPHLMIPVVTDPKKAAGSLQWAVTEMMRRYRAMSDAGVRDLESFNAMINDQLMDGTPLPQLIVIIDELADLMLVAAKEVEESICRIAQMGRAAGIHLVIATQRPSADVITGTMKANIPSRIAFSVASAMESRIILDTMGAEKLVGKGDMLFAPIGSGKPLRVQGCFVTDKEVESVVNFVKNNTVSDYDETVMAEIDKKATQTGNNKSNAAVPEPSSDELAGDEMLPAAVEVILETGQASVSMLQRRLKLGYSRAARIVDELEELHVVGPFAGSKSRAILVTREQWEQIRNGQPAQLDFNDLNTPDSEESDPDDPE